MVTYKYRMPAVAGTRIEMNVLGWYPRDIIQGGIGESFADSNPSSLRKLNGKKV